jgi:hypothetical protein
MLCACHAGGPELYRGASTRTPRGRAARPGTPGAAATAREGFSHPPPAASPDPIRERSGVKTTAPPPLTWLSFACDGSMLESARPAQPSAEGEIDAEVARGSWRREARAVRRAVWGEPSSGASGGRGGGRSLRRRGPERPRPLPPAEWPLLRAHDHSEPAPGRSATAGCARSEDGRGQPSVSSCSG